MTFQKSFGVIIVARRNLFCNKNHSTKLDKIRQAQVRVLRQGQRRAEGEAPSNRHTKNSVIKGQTRPRTGRQPPKSVFLYGSLKPFLFWQDKRETVSRGTFQEGAIERGLQNIVYGKKNPLVSIRDGAAVFNPATAAKEFGVGAAAGGILGAGQLAAAGSANAAEAYKQTNYSQADIESIRKEGKTFRNIVVGIDTNVSEFFAKWRGGRKPQSGDKLEKLYLGKMSEGTRTTVSDILGYEVNERDFVITNENVKHILDEHGNAEAELRKGNLPLEQWAIDALPEVVNSPDFIEPGKISGGLKNSGKRAIIFSKTFRDGKVITVQFDNKGRGTMEVTTMYVKQNESTPSVTDANSPVHTSETPKPVLSKESIPYPSNAVKPFSSAPQDYAALLRELAKDKAAKPSLTPEQRRRLEQWNNAFPELFMTEEEFLGR